MRKHLFWLSLVVLMVSQNISGGATVKKIKKHRLSDQTIYQQEAKRLALRGRNCPAWTKEEQPAVKRAFSRAFDKKGKVRPAWLSEFNKALKKVGLSPAERVRQEKPWKYLISIRISRSQKDLLEISPNGEFPIRRVGGTNVDDFNYWRNLRQHQPQKPKVQRNEVPRPERPQK